MPSRRLFETAKGGIMIVDRETGENPDVNPAMAAINSRGNISRPGTHPIKALCSGDFPESSPRQEG
jgi:hypothetical protein